MLWTLVAYVVGSVVHAAVLDQRRQAADARRHADEMEEMQMAFTAISSVARNVSLGSDARRAGVRRRDLEHGRAPGDDRRAAAGGFAITGSAGIPARPS